MHKARTLDGEEVACKLQYPEMASAVETDLSQLDLLFSLHRRMGAAIDTREIAREIRERVREELDYVREAKVARLYALMLADKPFVRVPRVEEDLSTRRLLTLQWLDGEPLTAFESAPQEARNAIAVGLFDAWWLPFLRYGVIHGDPHLGNYAVVASGRGRGAAGRGGQSVRLRLRAHLSVALRARRGRALSGAAGQRRGASRTRPMRCGASRSSRAARSRR